MSRFQRNIKPGNEEYELIIRLYKEGMSFLAIGRVLGKHHATIMYHIANYCEETGYKRPAQGRKPKPPPQVKKRPVHTYHRPLVERPGHCRECGIILSRAPGHNCCKSREKPKLRDSSELYGNSIYL